MIKTLTTNVFFEEIYFLFEKKKCTKKNSETRFFLDKSHFRFKHHVIIHTNHSWAEVPVIKNNKFETCRQSKFFKSWYQMCCICSKNIKWKRIAHLFLVFGSVEMIVVLSVVVVGPLVAVSSIGGQHHGIRYIRNRRRRWGIRNRNRVRIRIPQLQYLGLPHSSQYRLQHLKVMSKWNAYFFMSVTCLFFSEYEQKTSILKKIS